VAQLFAADKFGGAAVVVDLAQGHFFDEADVQAFVQGKLHQVRHFVGVVVFEGDAVEFDVFKAYLLGGADAVEDFAQVAMAGEVAEAVGVDAVEADVEAVDAGVFEALGVLAQVGGVGGHAQFVEAGQCAELFHEGDDAAPNEGFAAGDADFVDAEFGEALAELRHFFDAEQFVAWQEGHVFGHAVAAAQVAAVGDGQAHVGDLAAEAVDQLRVGVTGRRL